MEETVYFAHISPDNRKQSVDDHLLESAELAKMFAKAFNSEEFGYLAGMAHDIGKYSDAFQKRLFGGPKVDHSSAGALECAMIGQTFVGACVAGHHAGLPDFGNSRTDMPGDDTYFGRLKKTLPTRGQTYSGYQSSLPDTPEQPRFENDYTLSLWIRMLYSCLVDADFLDTEYFMKNGDVDRGNYDSIDTLQKRLSDYTSKWAEATTELNRLRNDIRKDCVAAGRSEKGLFSLTVPTGGGKTVSSLAFALEHAQKHNMQRVIYVIPYTSIIEQNAAVFREILGEYNVVEHHSEADHFYDENLPEKQKSPALAAENWDAPIIVTTAVQFFESLYANRPSKCRKLHNIANSVVIFDEAQSIPVGHLLPCMAVIGTLVNHFGVSAVMCSATQPFVADLFEKFAPKMPVREICRDVKGLFDALERVNYSKVLPCSIEELVSKISGESQTLCIVNTRKTAKDLFAMLPEEGSYHLSTLMTPDLRKKTLQEIKNRLNCGRSCRVISTSLIEAGVDIDFPTVYREMTGLDSIVQAAGRCNREGKRNKESCLVTVFELDRKVPPMLKINIGASKEALQTTEEIGSKEAVDRYFRSFRSLIGNENIDKTDAVKHFENGLSGCLLPFKTVAESFHLIDQNTKTVYIPTKESAELIECIRKGNADRNTYRKAGRFAVNVYEDHFIELLKAGDIEEISPGAAVLVNLKQYDEKTGLSLVADSGRAEFI